MPEGPLGAPRLTNIPPLSRQTEEDIKSQWEDCSNASHTEVCKELKREAISILENQGVFPECEDLVDINSGNCFNVAERVHGELDGVRVMVAGDRDHIWIEKEGIHYDAEAPTGVEDPFNLPFFQRFSPPTVLEFARIAAEAEGRKPPEHPRDTIKDITQEFHNAK